MRVILNTKPAILNYKSGIGYYVFNLHRELLKFNIDVNPTISVASGNFVGSLSKVSCGLRRFMGKYYPNSIVRYLGDFIINHVSINSVKASKFDIYHETIFDPLPEVDSIVITNLYDTILFIKDYHGLYNKDFINYAKTNIRVNVQNAKRVIVNTRFVKHEALHTLNIPEDKIDIIPLAPSPFFRVLDKSCNTANSLKKITEKEYILYVGTIEPRKNLKTLIRAFKDIRNKYDLSLILAGGLGYLSEDIISYSEELGIKNDVIFTKYVDEETLLCLYNHAQIFVFPSLYEGFGLPPLEAMACGVPVIISDIPPLREVAGDAAAIFNPKDYEELAGVIGGVLESEPLRSDMIQRGIRRAAEYSWEKTAKITIETYEKALES